MYEYIKGTIEYKGENYLVIDNNGIGYRLNVSSNCLSNLNSSQLIKVYTHLAVKEDDMSLFGFYSLEEKDMFMKLITINGVGPKLALAILSGLNVNEITSAIMAGDVKCISTVKGVGKKTAERLILELKGKIGVVETLPIENINGNNTSNNVNDAVLALIDLGYTRQEAYNAIHNQKDLSCDTSKLISNALRSLYK